MTDHERIRIAIQKGGRLSGKSLSLLDRCGLQFDGVHDKLFLPCENFPLDVMLVRDDDIPEYVKDGVCDLGIVGLNVLEEKLVFAGGPDPCGVEVAVRLGFGQCRLCLAVPHDRAYSSIESMNGLRVATSYPRVLVRFFEAHHIDAAVVEISGSVEIAPALRIADAICDLVSTGTTLKANGLKEVATVLESESILVRTRQAISPTKAADIDRLLVRIAGVLRAEHTKYVMMHAPRSALPTIRALLPGMEEPTILPLGTDGERVALHAVAPENVFWETMEQLRRAGATSILVVPIEKIL